jgi:putative transposase
MHRSRLPMLRAGAGSGDAEMYVQGVSIGNANSITDNLCCGSDSASTISAIYKRLDDSLTASARRRL